MRSTKNKRRSRTGARQGFSLIELLVVIVILAILAAIQYPSYLESVRKARRAEGRAVLMQLMQQEERYFSQNGTYIAFSSLEANGFKWFSADSAASSSYEISAAACQHDTIRNCVLLTAEPGTKNVNARYRDDLCGNLTLASTGVKAATGNDANCW
jgi:type IV pilus assembly protein PilE